MRGSLPLHRVAGDRPGARGATSPRAPRGPGRSVSLRLDPWLGGKWSAAPGNNPVCLGMTTGPPRCGQFKLPVPKAKPARGLGTGAPAGRGVFRAGVNSRRSTHARIDPLVPAKDGPPCQRLVDAPQGRGGQHGCMCQEFACGMEALNLPGFSGCPSTGVMEGSHPGGLECPGIARTGLSGEHSRVSSSERCSQSGPVQFLGRSCPISGQVGEKNSREPTWGGGGGAWPGSCLGVGRFAVAMRLTGR
jgi:hypothetical protein